MLWKILWIQLNKKTLEGFNSNQGIYTQDDTGDNGFWDWDNGREKEDLTWLINDKKR